MTKMPTLRLPLSLPLPLESQEELAGQSTGDLRPAAPTTATLYVSLEDWLLLFM